VARIVDLRNDGDQQELISLLRKSTESSELNFLLGSGCSSPAIPVLGNIEKKVQELRAKQQELEVGRALAEYLKEFAISTQSLLGTPDQVQREALEVYSSFLVVVSRILIARRSNIAPKHASIFTTNYDMFVERAFQEHRGPLVLSDGFDRRPCLDGTAEFSTAEFFKSVRKRGALYSYEVHVPSASLVKLHGSLGWRSDGDRILLSLEKLQGLAKEIEKLEESTKPDEYFDFVDQLPLIMPVVEKHRDTLLIQVYYDLLRIYSNELDKENVLLLSCGFSFEDEHILRVTQRSLRNPTLRLVIFSHTEGDVDGYRNKFANRENVNIVFSKDGAIDFRQFVTILENLPPQTSSPDEEASLSGAGHDE